MLSVLQLETYRRLKHLHHPSEARVGGLGTQLAVSYRQTKELFTLFSVLQLRAPLPATRGWAASPDFLSLLLRLAVSRRPRLIAELGTAASTLVLGYASRLVPDCRVVSVDHDADHHRRYRGLMAAHGLDDRVTLLLAPLRSIELNGHAFQWYDTAVLDGLANIDLLVIDGPPAILQSYARYPALPILGDRMALGSMVVMDDGNREDERVIAQRWIARELGWRLELRESLEKGLLLLVRDLKAIPGDGGFGGD